MKIATGMIEASGRKVIETENFEGDIVKVRIYNNRNNLVGTTLKAYTIDGECFINKQIDNNDFLLFPKNMGSKGESSSVGNQEINVNIDSSDERIYNDGPVIFIIENCGINCAIENIVITYSCGWKTPLLVMYEIFNNIARKNKADEVKRILEITGGLNGKLDEGRKRVSEINRKDLWPESPRSPKKIQEKRKGR